MTRAIALYLCTLIAVVNVEAFVRRDVSETTSPQILGAFQENIDQFRQCIDQTLGRTVGDVNEKQLQPLFEAISDHLGRLSKAFEDLTAPRKAQGPA